MKSYVHHRMIFLVVVFSAVVTPAQQSTPYRLSLQEAIAKGLQANLAVLVADTRVEEAEGTRMRRLSSALLPHVRGQSYASFQNRNLRAFGISFPGVPEVAGPFSNYDFRVYADQNVLDVQSYRNWKASERAVEAGKMDYQDARDLIIRSIASLYLNTQAAAARVEQTKADLALLKAGAWQPDIDIARAEVNEAQRQVERVQADLDRTLITAPITGEILQLKVRVGEYAQAGQLPQPLILMGATNQLNVRADVDEQDAWRVKKGAAAIASVRGDSTHRYALRFVRFEPYVIPKKNLTGDSTERVDTRVLQVVFALQKDSPVFAGQQMDVFIDAGAR